MNNPNDLDHTPGTRSSGVAAGGAGFDTGTDTASSMRRPCYFCGLVDIQPIPGWAQRAGNAISRAGLPNQPTQIGLIARNLKGSINIFLTILGPDDRALMVAPAPLRNPVLFNLKKSPGAFHTDNGVMRPVKDIAAAVKRRSPFFTSWVSN